MFKLLRRHAVKYPSSITAATRGVRTKKPPLSIARTTPDPPITKGASKARAVTMAPVQLLTIEDLASLKSSKKESSRAKKTSSSSSASSSSSSPSSTTEGLQDESPTINSTWNWIPPRHKSSEAAATTAETAALVNSSTTQLKGRNEPAHFATKVGEELTAEEITSALVRMGAEDVRTIDLPKNVNFDTITQFVVATSRSTRLLRKMADTIVHALQERRLDKAPGATGPEGDLDDDWLIVDCWTIAVHIMLPTARKSLNLEALWDGSTPRPALRPVRNEMDYDEMMDDLVQRFPPPADYPPLDEGPLLMREKDLKDLPVRRL